MAFVQRMYTGSFFRRQLVEIQTQTESRGLWKLIFTFNYYKITITKVQ